MSQSLVWDVNLWYGMGRHYPKKIYLNMNPKSTVKEESAEGGGEKSIVGAYENFPVVKVLSSLFSCPFLKSTVDGWALDGGHRICKTSSSESD